MTAATIHQLATSRGGVPKLPVDEADIAALGLVGDVQRNRKYHGGVDRAVCLYSLEVIERLRAEGHPIAPGATGENITVRGLDWAALQPGVRLALGDAGQRALPFGDADAGWPRGVPDAAVVLELTSFAVPCKNIAGSFADRHFARIAAPGLQRWYARVLRPGRVRPGDRVIACEADAVRG